MRELTIPYTKSPPHFLVGIPDKSREGLSEAEAQRELIRNGQVRVRFKKPSNCSSQRLDEVLTEDRSPRECLR